MKLLVGDKGNIDFAEPVKMSEQQRTEFEKFMKGIFYDVEFIHTNSQRINRVGSQVMWPRDWSPKELALILRFYEKDNWEVADMLARSEMAVLMRRAELLPQIIAFAKKKRKGIFAISSSELEALVAEFLKEQKMKKRAERDKHRKEKEELESIIAKLEWRQRDGQRIISLLEATGKKEDIKKYHAEKDRLLKRKKELEKLLEQR